MKFITIFLLIILVLVILILIYNFKKKTITTSNNSSGNVIPLFPGSLSNTIIPYKEFNCGDTQSFYYIKYTSIFGYDKINISPYTDKDNSCKTPFSIKNLSIRTSLSFICCKLTCISFCESSIVCFSFIKSPNFFINY